jgi:hypothetical protein
MITSQLTMLLSLVLLSILNYKYNSSMEKGASAPFFVFQIIINNRNNFTVWG